MLFPIQKLNLSLFLLLWISESLYLVQLLSTSCEHALMTIGRYQYMKSANSVLRFDALVSHIRFPSLNRYRRCIFQKRTRPAVFHSDVWSSHLCSTVNTRSATRSFHMSKGKYDKARISFIFNHPTTIKFLCRTQEWLSVLMWTKNLC